MLLSYVVCDECGKIVYSGSSKEKAKEEALKYNRLYHKLCYIYEKKMIDIIGG